MGRCCLPEREAPTKGARVGERRGLGMSAVEPSFERLILKFERLTGYAHQK